MIRKDAVNARFLKEVRIQTLTVVKLSEKHKKSEEFWSNFFLLLTKNIMTVGCECAVHWCGAES